MPLPTQPIRHSPTTMLLHWSAAAIVVAAFLLGLFLEDWTRGPQRDFAMMVHYSLGSIVLAFALFRVLRHLLLPQPPAIGGSLATLAGSVMHWALYAVMVALPLAGVLDRWARGRRLAIFNIELPAPFAVPGGELWGEAHELLAWALLALVAAHVAAALWHHVVLHDGVLRRMLPFARA